VHDELALKVRQKFEILLLLARPHHLQFVTEQRLELFLQTEQQQQQPQQQQM